MNYENSRKAWRQLDTELSAARRAQPNPRTMAALRVAKQQVAEAHGLPDWSSLETWVSQRLIDSVLLHMAATPLSERILVFGSLARGGQRPADVDCFVDFPTQRLERAAVEMACLGVIARRFYGLLDPFFRVEGLLYTRNASAIHYERAANSHALLQAIAAEGRPLAEVLAARSLSPVVAVQVV